MNCPTSRFVFAAMIVLIASDSECRAAYTQLTANKVNTELTLNGSVNATKYGGGPAVFADFSNLSASNPSRFSDLNQGTFVTRTNSQFSYSMYAAYSSTTLYFGFDVHDDYVRTVAGQPFAGTNLELFIGGDRVGNNFSNFGSVSSKRAFQVAATTDGTKYTNAGGTFTNASWSIASSAVTSTGYQFEFAIPLNLIDTNVGGAFTPATVGSLLRFNVGSYKSASDRPITGSFGSQYSVLDAPYAYGSYPAFAEFSGTNVLWSADLLLSPVPEPAAMVQFALGFLASAFLIFTARNRNRMENGECGAGLSPPSQAAGIATIRSV